MDVERFLQLGRVTEVVPSPDGSWAAVSVERAHECGDWISHLWRVAIAPGDAPIRLTDGNTRDTMPRFRSDGTLLFLSTRDADDGKRAQVWALGAGGATQITDEPLGVTAFDARGEALVVVTPLLPDVPHDAQRQAAADLSARGPSVLRFRTQPTRRWDHWLGPAQPHLVRLGPGARRDLLPDPGNALEAAEWALSPDGTRAAVTPRRPSPDGWQDAPLWVIDVATGHKVQIDGGHGVRHARPAWSSDGRLATLRHQRAADSHGPVTLFVTETGGGAREVSADLWLEPAGWFDGCVVAMARDRADQHVYLVRGDRVTAVTTAGGTHEGVRVAGGVAVGIRHSLTQPPEPFTVALQPGAEPRLLARLSGAPSDLADGIAVSWHDVPAPDGGAVHAARVGPAEAPVVLWVHGGPVSAWGDGWHWRWNPLPFAAAGVAIALPNPRGSTGYGRQWVEDIWGNTWGQACYRDLMAVADALGAEAVMGGSFGGWMTNWIASQTARFRCAITHAGIYDHRAMYGDCDSPGEWAWHLGSTPYDGGDHDKHSPHRFVDRWRTPTLILHGEKDYCVPVSQAHALFAALDLRGVPCELAVFPDEGHWVLRPANITAWYEVVQAFLDEWLRTPADPDR